MPSNNISRNFFLNYFDDYKKHISCDKNVIKNLLLLKKKITDCKKNNKKILIFGNGGSSAIASHFAVDLSKNTKIKCLNFSDSSMITCFSNDFGYKNYISNIVDIYGDNGDMIILISSSGMSENIINAVKKTRVKFSNIVTFSGFSKKNKLSKLGDINFYVDSKIYNFVENIHQLWLLSVIDSIFLKYRK